MKHNEKEIEKKLDEALGKPKYYIDASVMEEGERYAWFPTLGDSMTDGTPKSIPSGSFVLGRWLKFNSIHDVPLHRPIVVILNIDGEQFCVLKSACKIHSSPADASDEVCLRSYNPARRCDDLWVPFNYIKFIFVVEIVRRPDGHEFIPKQEEVIRKTRKAK